MPYLSHRILYAPLLFSDKFYQLSQQTVVGRYHSQNGKVQDLVGTVFVYFQTLISEELANS